VNVWMPVFGQIEVFFSLSERSVRMLELNKLELTCVVMTNNFTRQLEKG